MKSISFKNFRRFADFPEFKFGDITILVGGNNSGKSTLVKALLLVLDNLKTMRREINLDEKIDIFKTLTNLEFRFDENTFHELNIKNFSRALKRHCGDNTRMTFTLEVEHPLSNDIYRFEIIVSKYSSKNENANSNDDARGLIDFISVSNLSKDTHFDFSFTTWNGEASYMRVRIADESARELATKIDSLKQQKNELTQYIKTIEPRLEAEGILDPNAVGKLNDRKAELDKIEKVLKDITSDKDKVRDVEVKIPFSTTLNQVSKYLIIDLIKDIIAYTYHSSKEKKGSKAYNQEEANRALLKAHRATLEEFSDDVRYLLDFFGIDYIQAHGVTQKTLFSTADSDDHIAKTVKKFMQSRAWRNDEIRKFIQHWMEVFNIGYDFEIEDIDGEAYKVFILETADDKIGFPLADLGMGSIQLMMLLFALAISIKHNIGSVFGNPTVIIEEPEQNLHPAVQSKLADILYQVNKDFGLKFIVETHSEYLLREIQIIVAKHRLAISGKNPFRVYYFNKETGPYDMGFQNNGKFIESFGPGFFDVADNAALKLFEYDEE